MKKIIFSLLVAAAVVSPLYFLVADAATNYYVGTRRSGPMIDGMCGNEPCPDDCDWTDCGSGWCQGDVCLDPCEWSNDCDWDEAPCEDGCLSDFDPCQTTWCYPQHDDSEYGSPSPAVTNDNSNDNVSQNNNTNINENEIYINIYGNGTVSGSGIDLRSLPSCNNGLDDDDDGRLDFNDSDCQVYGKENGKNARLNKAAPVFVTVAPTDAREGAVYTYDADARDSDSDDLTYRLLESPSGMVIERSNGFIRWTPTRAQAGMAHGVTVSVSDGDRQAVQSFQIFVERLLVREVVAVAQPVRGQVAGTAKVVAVADAAEKSTLRAYNIRVDTDELGNSVVTWDTTRPTRGRVLFGLASQGDRSGTDFTGAGQYEFSTPNTPETSTSHRVILGQLETDRSYYFRVVSFAGTDVIASSERSFVRLGDGETMNGETGFASVIGTLGSFIFSAWFLLLVIIIITLIIVFRRRSQHEIVAHAPVEMHAGGGHH